MRNKIVVFLIACLGFIACKKEEEKPDNTNTGPEKLALNFPEKDAACNSGTVVSATQTTVTFSWKGVANTATYVVTLKNLLNNVITTQAATTNQVDIVLLRNTPYSWYVISRSEKAEVLSQSDVWKFYNSGIGEVSHLPFPAEAVLPAFGATVAAATGTVNLSWTGTDVDNDIAAYDVYFGTTASPALLKAGVPTPAVENVAVAAKTTYYWRVVTKDALGNTSDSELFQFKTN